MTIPTQQLAYSQGQGTSPIPSFIFSQVDPGPYNSSYPLYQGWVNTVTKAIWYLEALISSNGSTTAQWRAVGPIVISVMSPMSSDYQYPLGQLWIDTASQTCWALVLVAGAAATWVSLGGGTSTGILSVELDTFTSPGTNPTFPNGGGQIIITGNQVASGTNAHAIQSSSLAANSITIEVQRTTTAASSTVGLNGISHFNSGDFTVDSNGFVSSISGGFTREVEVDTFAGPGTNPVTATAGGLITVTGGQVPASTTANVIRTDSLAANTYTIQVQRSQAVAESTVGDNGVSHFNSSDFTVDSNGFVSAVSSTFSRQVEVDAHTSPGTDPVEPDSTGTITVTGGQIAAGTTANVIQTDSLAANTYTIQVQRSQAVASTTVADNGVCHFNSADFTVDSNGFVSAVGGLLVWSVKATSFSALVNNGYFISAASVTATLPTSPIVGDTVEFVSQVASAITIQAATGQKIEIGTSTSAVAGNAQSTAKGDSISFVYEPASATWWAIGAPQGSWNVT